MEKGKVSYEMLIGSMRVIADGINMNSLEAQGLSRQEFKFVSSKQPWVGSDRVKVQRILSALLQGTLDVIGLPRMQLPAEYAASVINFFVHPCNYMTACVWCERVYSSESILDNQELKEDYSPDELFALVLIAQKTCLLYTSPSPRDRQKSRMPSSA